MNNKGILSMVIHINSIEHIENAYVFKVRPLHESGLVNLTFEDTIKDLSSLKQGYIYTVECIQLDDNNYSGVSVKL